MSGQLGNVCLPLPTPFGIKFEQLFHFSSVFRAFVGVYVLHYLVVVGLTLALVVNIL